MPWYLVSPGPANLGSLRWLHYPNFGHLATTEPGCRPPPLMTPAFLEVLRSFVLCSGNKSIRVFGQVCIGQVLYPLLRAMPDLHKLSLVTSKLQALEIQQGSVPGVGEAATARRDVFSIILCSTVSFLSFFSFRSLGSPCSCTPQIPPFQAFPTHQLLF